MRPYSSQLWPYSFERWSPTSVIDNRHKFSLHRVLIAFDLLEGSAICNWEIRYAIVGGRRTKKVQVRGSRFEVVGK